MFSPDMKIPVFRQYQKNSIRANTGEGLFSGKVLLTHQATGEYVVIIFTHGVRASVRPSVRPSQKQKQNTRNNGHHVWV